MSVAVANFIRERIITQFGILYKVINDNGIPFVNNNLREVLVHYRVKYCRHAFLAVRQWASESYTLKCSCKIVFNYGRNGSSHLADALWIFQSLPNTKTGFAHSLTCMWY